MIDYDEAKPVIVELARRTARVFEHAPFAAFLEKWANPPDDPAEEKALVAEYHMFRVAFEGLVRPAEAVEGRVVGSDYALALRTASHLVGMLAAPDRWEELSEEIEDAIEDLRRRLDRVELDRIPVVRPKLYEGPLVP